MKKIISIILSFIFIFCVLSTVPVMADSASNYSGVLSDLGKDDAFDKSLYPLVVGDKSLNVIQVAEGAQNELYVYVYQPSGTTDIQASSINISKVHKGVDYKNYTLTLVSQEGVFHKYLVNGFTVDSTNIRYYEITSIYRVAIEGEDHTTDDNGNTITEVSYAVKKSFEITDYNTYVEDIEVIAITSKYVGFMRYPVGTFLFDEKNLDVHFVAFTTDKKIDNLLEADVYYKRQDIVDSELRPDEYGEIISDYAYLKADKDMVFKNNGWNSTSYSWKAIEKAEDFINNSEGSYTLYEGAVFDKTGRVIMNDTAKENISNKDWVLRFAYTTYYDDVYSGGQITYSTYYYTNISDVSVLRLAFETDDVYYNLGVIDNKQTGDENPVNTVKTELTLSDDFKFMMTAIIVILLFIALCRLWEILLPGIKFIFQILIFPFKLLFGGGKKRK